MARHPHHTSQRRALRTTLVKLACVMALGAGLLATQAASAAEDPWNPGLPVLTGTNWVAAATTGMNKIDRAKQWVRIPPLVFSADTLLWGSYITEGNDPLDPVKGCNQPWWLKDMPIFSKLYVRSPKDAPAPYGYFPPITVRTVAFGAIPAEATVQISQVRDQENLPVSLQVKALYSKYWDNSGAKALASCGPGSPWPTGDVLGDAHVTGQLDVKVSAITVDGVAMDVGTECRTARPATLKLTGKGYWVNDPGLIGPLPIDDNKNSPYYDVNNGGPIQGTIDIPPFTGCQSGTEDLSPLLTSMVSGSDNPMKARQGRVGAQFRPPNIPNPIPFPTRPAA